MHSHFVLLLSASSFLYLSLAPDAGCSAAERATCIASAEFVIRSYPGGPSATELLQKSEHLRQRLAKVWLGAAPSPTWNPRCEVVVHPTRASYLRSVGQGGAQTSGSSMIRAQGGRIVLRRIDLIADTRGELSALAHELTHVVIADRFRGRQPPRWLDEGIAMLSDSGRKQSLHERDCREAVQNGTALRLSELLSLDQFTSSRQVAPFYGQSFSLISYLAEREDPAKVISFAETARLYGYDRALGEHYGISSVAELERSWRSHLARAETTGATKGLLISMGD